MKRKYTKWDIDKVRKYFEDHDCELLETKYINSKTLMRYECSCGNDDCKIRFEDFKRGQRCIECSGNKKLTLEYVKQYFEDNDCKLIEKEYVNVDTLMEYECKCGNKECKITFSNFKQGRRCNECGIKRTAEKLKYTFKQVKEFFEKEECILKSTVYINANTLLEYICVCERPSKITFSRFRQGQRCRKCAIERNSGENSGSWNPNLTDEDRKKHRDGDPRYYQWRKEVYKRDYYICQVSGKKKR